MTKLVVHHLENSRSQRLLWLLEELGLDYEIVRYERTRGGRAPRTLRDVHPLGKSPVVTEGDLVLAESGALAEELVDRADGKLRPAPGTEAHRRYRFFIHFAEGSMMSPLLVKLIFARLRKAIPLLGNVIANKVDAQFTDAEITRHLDFVESTLEGQTWICGDELTAADTLMCYPLQASMLRGAKSSYPNVRAYIARAEARDAYKRALERGGPFSVAV